MPQTLYAISFKRTRHVLAIISIEKRDLKTPADATALLKEVVGTQLTLSVSSGSPVKVAATELAIDPLTEPPSATDIVSNFYAYQIDVPSSSQLGDGSDKSLVEATKQVGKFKFNGTTALTVTLGAADGTPDPNVWLLFEGAGAPLSATTLANVVDFDIPISQPLAASTGYGFVLLKDKVPVTAGFIKT